MDELVLPTINSYCRVGSYHSWWEIILIRFYLPAALVVPPSQFLVHSQFVFLFQVGKVFVFVFVFLFQVPEKSNRKSLLKYLSMSLAEKRTKY